jgi:hypothetical protein
MIIRFAIFILIVASAGYYALLLLEMAGRLKWTGESRRRLRMFPFYYLFHNDKKSKKTNN